MLDVTTEAMRVCRGPVLWIVAGVTRKRCYWPAPEGLMWNWYKKGGECHLYRPCIFERSGIPGSGGDDWFANRWEYVLCFKRPGKLLWSENTAMGHIPKWSPGGEMSNRLSDGSRVNQWGGSASGKSMRARDKDGVMSKAKPKPSHVVMRVTKGTGKTGEQKENRSVPFPAIANPGNVIKCNVGGGHLGSRLAHKNEAPFPEKLAEFFIRSLCPPGGIVYDCFCGSGTTAVVAKKFGRNFLASDLRISQCELTKQRLKELPADIFEKL